MTAEAHTADASGFHPWRMVARWPHAALAVLCLVLWLPGIFTLPPLDRDESRFAEASKQMLESGDFIDIRFGHVPRYKKPVGIYWLQAATTAVAGLGARDEIWTYRLASLLGGIAAVWLVFWCASCFAPPEGALAAAALLGATLLLGAEATVATTDAVLLAATLGAQAVLLRIYLSARDAARAAPSLALVLGGWASLGLAVLVKGPVAPAVCAITAVVLSLWDRDWTWLKGTRVLLGLGVALLIVAPWLVAITISSHGEFFRQSLGTDFVGKLAGGQESHGAPPGYYLALVSFTLWPATLFLVPGLGAAIAHRADPAIRFLLVWALASWVAFEFVPTKLPHYVLPLYPPLAMIGALWACRWQSLRDGFPLLRVAGAAQFVLGAAVLATGLVVIAARYGQGPWTWLLLPAAAVLTLSIAAAYFVTRRLTMAGAALAIMAAIVLYPSLTLLVGPRLQTLWVSPRAAALVAHARRPADPPVAVVGYQEPSLLFLLGSETRLTNADGAAEIGADAGGLALVERGETRQFLAQAASLGAMTVPLGSIDGLDYSRGKPVLITLYRTVPAHLETAPPPE